LTSGEYAGVRECQIEGNWLLIYDKDGLLEGGSSSSSGPARTAVDDLNANAAGRGTVAPASSGTG
jgi:hypothetical protein